jgi:hypothetical protein
VTIVRGQEPSGRGRAFCGKIKAGIFRVQTAWRSAQSGANLSPPEFPANRENNREFRQFRLPKLHFFSLNRTFWDRSGSQDASRNREITGQYQGI